MKDTDDLVPFNTLILQKIKFDVAQTNLFPQDLKFDFEKDYIKDVFTHYLTWTLLGKTIQTRRYPATWWDAFKNRWVPNFLKKRYPVKWDEFKLYNICPHIDHKWSEDSKIHISWIEGDHGFAPKEENKN